MRRLLFSHAIAPGVAVILPLFVAYAGGRSTRELKHVVTVFSLRQTREEAKNMWREKKRSLNWKRSIVFQCVPEVVLKVAEKEAALRTT
jgi:hypothetical protein